MICTPSRYENNLIRRFFLVFRTLTSHFYTVNTDLQRLTLLRRFHASMRRRDSLGNLQAEAETSRISSTNEEIVEIQQMERHG